MLEIVHRLTTAAAADPFSPSVLNGLREIIPSRDATYFDRSRDVTVASRDVKLEPVLEGMAAFGNERPTAAARLRPGDGTVRLSACLSSRDFVRMNFYQEAMRPIGIEDELSVRFPGRGIAGLSIISDRKFTERDRLVLDALVPYLAWAHRQGSTLGRRRSGIALTGREREILEWVARGRTNKEIAGILGVRPSTVRKHLENVFAKLEVNTRTAAVAAAFGRDPSAGASRSR